MVPAGGACVDDSVDGYSQRCVSESHCSSQALDNTEAHNGDLRAEIGSVRQLQSQVLGVDADPRNRGSQEAACWGTNAWRHREELRRQSDALSRHELIGSRGDADRQVELNCQACGIKHASDLDFNDCVIGCNNHLLCSVNGQLCVVPEASTKVCSNKSEDEGVKAAIKGD